MWFIQESQMSMILVSSPLNGKTQTQRSGEHGNGVEAFNMSRNDHSLMESNSSPFHHDCLSYDVS